MPADREAQDGCESKYLRCYPMIFLSSIPDFCYVSFPFKIEVMSSIFQEEFLNTQNISSAYQTVFVVSS